MKTIEIGSEIELTKNARSILGVPDIPYTVIDILPKIGDEQVQHRIVIGAEKLGKDWVQFVNKSEVFNP